MSNFNDAFKGLPWVESVQKSKVLLCGLGGIGTYTLYFLKRAGFQVDALDFDILENRNLSGQLFKHEDIGKTKTEAMLNVLKDFIPNLNYCNLYKSKIQNFNFYNSYNIFISALDNMAARKFLFSKWLSNTLINSVFIDGRLTAEYLQIFCINKSDTDAIKKYEEEQLFDDSEVQDVPCTMKQTSHSAGIIGGLITSFAINSVLNTQEGKTVRDVPYTFEMFLPLNLINHE